jgi:hypothetical protein
MRAVMRETGVGWGGRGDIRGNLGMMRRGLKFGSLGLRAISQLAPQAMAVAVEMVEDQEEVDLWRVKGGRGNRGGGDGRHGGKRGGKAAVRAVGGWLGA